MLVIQARSFFKLSPYIEHNGHAKSLSSLSSFVEAKVVGRNTQRWEVKKSDTHYNPSTLETTLGKL